MNTMTRKTYTLGGLGCAHCAEKIQRGLSALDPETRFTLIFSTGSLVVETPVPERLPQLMESAQALITEIEPGVLLKAPEASAQPEAKALPIFEYRLGLAFLLFIPPLLLDLGPGFEAVLYLSAYGIAGYDVVWKALRNLVKGHMLDEHFLMTIATLGALAVDQLAEAAAVMLFYQVGELFQGLAVQKSRRSVKALLTMKVEETRMIHQGTEVMVPTESVPVGALISVRPGERIPLDGVVESGSGTLDTSALTGEALPREIEAGSEVLSGSINLTHVLQLRVTTPYANSTVAKILHLVEDASSRKAPAEQFITRFARIYTPAVVFAAAALALLPPLVLGWEQWPQWLYRALIFLVISCPCALVISIPLGFFGGIGAASRAGILVKGSNYLEALTRVDTVVFDKTGTLTAGRFTVYRLEPTEGISEERLLELAAYGESGSTHPIARSIVAAWGKPLDGERINGLIEVHGQGVRGTFEGLPLLAGSKKLLREAGLVPEDAAEAGTAVYVAYDGAYTGRILVKDQMKPGTREALKALKAAGVRRLALLTGDTWDTARSLAAEAGIDEVHGELLPQDKVTVLESLMASLPQGGKLVFVGDGINDAPVLARADIGIAMGGLGSDAAVEAADIVLMTDEPAKVAEAISIARFTRQVVVQNIVLAFAVKGLVLVLGAGGLATLWEAVFADVGVAVLAILNAMRVLKGRRAEGGARRAER